MALFLKRLQNGPDLLFHAGAADAFRPHDGVQIGIRFFQILVDQHVVVRLVIPDLLGGLPQPPGDGFVRVFAAGAQALTESMNTLNDEWAQGTAECRSRDLVVSHEAFGYLAAQYDFAQIGIAGLSPDAEPSPARIAEVADLVRERGVTTIYYETLVDPSVAETLAAETVAREITSARRGCRADRHFAFGGVTERRKAVAFSGFERWKRAISPAEREISRVAP